MLNDPWGPPWMRKASGYLFPSSKPTGLTIHPQTVSPLAPLKEKRSGCDVRACASASWLTWVIWTGVPPSRPTVNSSTGEVRVSSP